MSYIYKLSLFICILSICLVCLKSQYVDAYNQPELYSPVDDVIRLNSTDFIPTVFHQNRNITYMVQFYNTFCGHCQMFAPIYKDLASRVRNWTSVFRIAAIDCSKDENTISCSENRIEGYPTIYIFPPNARVQEPKDAPLNLRSLNIDWNVDDIEESIVDYLTNLTTTRQEYPLLVKALQPITVTSLEELQRIYPLEAKQNEMIHDHNSLQDLMFIIESEKSYLGRRLIVEYYRIHSKLELRRILLSNQKLIKTLLSSEDYAKLDDSQPILIKLNGLPSDGYTLRKAQVLVRGEENHVLPTSADHERLDYISDRFKSFFEHYYSIELENENNNSDSNKNHFNEKPKLPLSNGVSSHKENDELEIQYLLHSDPSIKKRIFALDLLKGISYMITHEVKIKGDLSPDEFNTVRNILTLFKKYLPLEKWDSTVYKFIVELRTRFDDNRSTYEINGIKAQEVRDILDLSGADVVRLRYGRENWVSCFESDRRQKGYTCSLWLLFHTMTVGEFAKAAPVRTRPTMVLFTMRDYITKFLGCTVCSANYAKETESLDSSLSARNSSVLWLWNTHNRVNQRLNNERAVQERKQLIDVIFPDSNSCSQCIKGDVQDIGVDGKTLDDIDWDMENVMNYLITNYKPDNVITPIEMAALMSNVKNKFNYDVLGSNNNKDNGFESLGRLSSSSGGDLNKSVVEQWNIQSYFSTSDISLCLFLYVACIVIVAIVCVALNPTRLKRLKTKL